MEEETDTENESKWMNKDKDNAIYTSGNKKIQSSHSDPWLSFSKGLNGAILDLRIGFTRGHEAGLGIARCFGGRTSGHGWRANK